MSRIRAMSRTMETIDIRAASRLCPRRHAWPLPPSQRQGSAWGCGAGIAGSQHDRPRYHAQLLADFVTVPAQFEVVDEPVRYTTHASHAPYRSRTTPRGTVSPTIARPAAISPH